MGKKYCGEITDTTVSVIVVVTVAVVLGTWYGQQAVLLPMHPTIPIKYTAVSCAPQTRENSGVAQVPTRREFSALYPVHGGWVGVDDGIDGLGADGSDRVSVAAVDVSVVSTATVDVSLAGVDVGAAGAAGVDVGGVGTTRVDVGVVVAAVGVAVVVDTTGVGVGVLGAAVGVVEVVGFDGDVKEPTTAGPKIVPMPVPLDTVLVQSLPSFGQHSHGSWVPSDP